MASGYGSGFLDMPDPNSGTRRQCRVTRYRETMEHADFIEMDALPQIGHKTIPRHFSDKIFSHTHSRKNVE